MAGSPQGVGDRMIRIGLMVLIPGGVETDRSPKESGGFDLGIQELVCFLKLAEKLPSVSRADDFQQCAKWGSTRT